MIRSLFATARDLRRHPLAWSIAALICALSGLAAPIAGSAQGANAVFAYPFPKPLQYSHHNDDFTVQVRVPGGTWQDLYEWNARVDWDKPQDASMVYFDFTGRAELRIQKNNGSFSSVTIGPETGAPKPVVRDGIVHLTLDRPQNFAVFFDSDRLQNLHVFAGAPIAPPMAASVRRFGPGLHRPTDGGAFFDVRSGETIFLEGGAVLMGTFRIDQAHDVRITGHGLILQPPGAKGSQLLVTSSRDVTVDGPIVVQADAGVARSVMSRDVRFSDIKGISGGQWTDGINIYSSERITLDRLFLRTSDDSVTVYAHRNEIYGDSRDVRVTNSTLWADIAHAVTIGIHGNTIKPETIERLTFDNIDVVSVDEDEPMFEGVFAIQAGDSNLVRDVTFSNIRVDRIEEAKLFNFTVGFSDKYNTSPGRGIEKVVVRNVSYTGKGMPSASIIAGYDAERGVRDVLIDNLTIAGRKITSADGETIRIDPFVSGVRFK